MNVVEMSPSNLFVRSPNKHNPHLQHQSWRTPAWSIPLSLRVSRPKSTEMPKPETRFEQSSRPLSDRTAQHNQFSQEFIQPPQHTVSTPSRLMNLTNNPVAPTLSSAEKAIVDEIASIQSLAEIASKSPYYKYAPHRDTKAPLTPQDTMECGQETFRMPSLLSYFAAGSVAWEDALSKQRQANFSRSRKSEAFSMVSYIKICRII